jgi:hypothetical protein
VAGVSVKQLLGAAQFADVAGIQTKMAMTRLKAHGWLPKPEARIGIYWGWEHGIAVEYGLAAGTLVNENGLVIPTGHHVTGNAQPVGMPTVRHLSGHDTQYLGTRDVADMFGVAPTTVKGFRARGILTADVCIDRYPGFRRRTVTRMADAYGYELKEDTRD